MQKRQEKMPWTQPELIVLVRNNPEEAVLLHCKIVKDETGKPGTMNYNQGCTFDPDQSCGNCQARAKT